MAGGLRWSEGGVHRASSGYTVRDDTYPPRGEATSTFPGVLNLQRDGHVLSFATIRIREDWTKRHTLGCTSQVHNAPSITTDRIYSDHPTDLVWTNIEDGRCCCTHVRSQRRGRHIEGNQLVAINIVIRTTLPVLSSATTAPPSS